MYVLMKKLRRSPHLPGCQAALSSASCFPDDAVALKKMGSQDEAEPIQREYRRTVVAAHEWKNASSDLGNYQVVFEDSETIVVHSAESEIPRDVVEPFTRDGVVKVIESTTRPAPWSRSEIDHVGAEWIDGRCRNDLIFNPQLIT
jgi:hypothetical protein